MDADERYLRHVRTIRYYNENAKSFCENTVNADMSEQLDEFISFLPEGGAVLDAGCGSGRDSLYLINRGFRVEAFDASEEICRSASALIGQEVKQCRFEDLSFNEQFDGVWACASLLHVSREDMPDVIERLYMSLKKDGILYASFKKGDGECEREGRLFTDADERYIREILEDGFKIMKICESRDVRPGRENEMWINAFAKKLSRE